jgi:hypothetical protein
MVRPAAFTQAIIVILLLLADVLPITDFSSLAAMNFTGWCSKFSPVSSQFHI